MTNLIFILRSVEVKSQTGDLFNTRLLFRFSLFQERFDTSPEFVDLVRVSH